MVSFLCRRMVTCGRNLREEMCARSNFWQVVRQRLMTAAGSQGILPTRPSKPRDDGQQEQVGRRLPPGQYLTFATFWKKAKRHRVKRGPQPVLCVI